MHGAADAGDRRVRLARPRHLERDGRIDAVGDLASDYGVPLNSIKWRLHHADTLAIRNVQGLDMEVLPEGTNLAEALADGEIDALFVSRTPRLQSDREGAIRHLFPDPRLAEEEYVGRHGFWPIMHIVAVKEELAAANPDLPVRIMEAFADASRIASGYLNDPNWSQMVWGKYAFVMPSNVRSGLLAWPPTAPTWSASSATPGRKG